MAKAKAKQKHCTDCQSAIRNNQRRCDTCNDRDRNRRAWEANAQTFMTTSGVACARPLPPTTFKRVTEFTTGRFNRLTSADTCGALADAILGALFAGPPYVRADDVRRYAAWVEDFRNHKFGRSVWSRRETGVADVPLEFLCPALRAWVEDAAFRSNDRNDRNARNASPLNPSLALATADFIYNHAAGFERYDDDGWRLLPFLDDAAAAHTKSARPYCDTSLKREITERLGRLLVRAVVPAGAYGWKLGQDVWALNAGDAFVFQIIRCHLSMGVGDYIHTSVHDTPVAFDIAANFEFYGGIFCQEWQDGQRWSDLRPLIAPPVTAAFQPTDHRLVNCTVPARWLTHYYDFPDGTLYNGYTPVPLPSYALAQPVAVC